MTDAVRSFALCNGRVLLGGIFRDDRAVLVAAGRIAAIGALDELPSGLDRIDLEGRLLLPGFIDVQVNGGCGILFNDAPSVETIRTIGAAHRRFGTTGFLPTLISGDLAMVRQALAAVDDAIAAGVPGVLGIHLEGPFLNPARGGIHDRSRIRELDAEGLALITSPRRGKTLVTLAPECTTPAMIERLTRAGVIVSAGHTNATYQQTRLAIAQGLTGFTHLFNAMSQLTAREPGAVGAALDDPNCWCGLIADGHHVDAVTLRLALRAKRDNAKFMLVSDAMACVGTTATSFVLDGQTITVAGGACINAEGTLAGADLDLARAVWKASELLGLPIAETAAMASLHPAAFLGLTGERGAIAVGLRADLVALDDTGHVHDCWIGGARR